MGAVESAGSAIQRELPTWDKDNAHQHGRSVGTRSIWNDIGQIHMKWDNGRTLALVPGEDSFRKLTDAELREEQSECVTEDVDCPALEM